MTEEQSTIKKTVFTLSDKRDLMWNFTEPGDPYDIRKSMIAKLPGEQKFMGPHLELVCLLQAAEIQRLCEFLEEFKMKFRENERVELDRHSYEVQIKELTEKLSEDHTSRHEVEKLREFIRRQSIELEELQRQKHSIDLGKNYEESLRQIAELKQFNARLSNEVRTYQEKFDASEEQKYRELSGLRQELERRNEYQQQQELKYREYSAHFESEKSQLQQELLSMGEGFQKTRELEGENKTLKKEIERLNIDLAKALQLGHTISEYENRFQILAEEIDRLNNVLREKSRELTEEYARSRQLGEMSQQKDEELVEFQEKIRELEGSNSKLQREHRETLASLSNLEQTKSLTQSYEASLEKLSIEVDRLNNVLRKKLNELDEARRKNNEYEIKLKTLEAIERENSDYKIRYAEVNKKISDYERKIAEGREENERLNYSIKKLIGELNSSELKFKGFEKEIENLHKTIEILSSEIQSERDGRQNLSSQLNGLRVQNESLKYTLSKNDDSKRIYDTKISHYLTEIKKLQRELENKDDLVESIKSSKSETELKIRQIESINQSDQEYIEELLNKNRDLYDENQKLKSALEATVPSPSPASIMDQNILISKQYEEITRLNDLLLNKENETKKLAEENEQLRTTINSGKWKSDREPSHYPSLFPPQSSEEHESPTQQLEGLLREKDTQITSLQEQIQGLQLNLISKEQTMRYYVSDNERYYSENAQLKNNLQERQLRIQRLENELDRIQALIAEKSIRTVHDQQISDDNVRLQLQFEVLKEKYDILSDQNESNLLKLHSLQEEMIKLQYKLAQNVRNLTEETSKTYPSGQEELISRQGQSEPDYIENVERQIQFLKERCDYLTQENEKYKIKVFSLEEQGESLLYKLQLKEEAQEQDKRRHKPSEGLENYQHEYQTVLERYNTLLLYNDQLKQEVKDLKEANSQFLSKKPERVDVPLPQSNEMRKKNEQIAQYYNKILLFSSEIERLNTILSTKQSANNDLRQKIQGLQAKVRDFNAELQRARSDQGSSFSFQERNRLGEEIQFLKQANINLEQKIREYELRENRSRAEIDQQRKVFENKTEVIENEILRLNNILEVKIAEQRLLQQKYRNLNRQFQEERQKRKLPNEYETKIALLGQEIERLNGVMKLKIDNYKLLEEEHNRYQKETYNRINNLTQQLRQFQEQNFKLSSELSQLKSKDHIKGLQIQSLNEYESKIIQLSNEIERLNRILYSNKQRIEQLEDKESKYLVEIQRLNNSLRLKVEESIMYEGRESSFSIEKESLIREVSDQKREYELLRSKFKQVEEEAYISKQHLAEYEKRIKELYEQFERLQKIITTLKKENDEKSNNYINQLIQKNRFLGSQIERLNRLNQKQGQDLSDLRIHVVEDNSLQRRINEDLALFVVLFAEIQSLRETVKDQEREIEEVRRENVAARLV